MRRAQCAFDQRQPVGDLRLVPLAAILVLEQNNVAIRGRARGAAGVVQQHEGEQPGDRRAPGQQFLEQPAKADRLAREILAHQRRAGGPGVAFGKHQIDDGEYAIEALIVHVRRRRCVRNTRVPDLALGAHQTLRHRLFIHQKSARHRFGR